MTISKNEARRLARQAAEMSASVLRGELKIGLNGATIDGTDLLDWLANRTEGEVILVAASVDQSGVQSNITRTCQRCGRDYQGETCAHCAQIRQRLRGR